MEASILDMTRALGRGDPRAAHLFDQEALEVEIEVNFEVLYAGLYGAAAPTPPPGFIDDDGVVVTTTDDVIQLDRSNRFHSVYLAIALVAAALGSLTI